MRRIYSPQSTLNLPNYDVCRNISNMKRPVSLPGGKLEHAVLSALWDLRSASVSDIHLRIGEPAGLVYTTIAKVLDRLHLKGLVSRKRRGRGFIYRPTVEREVLEQERARDILTRYFGSAPRPAIATLVDAVESIDATLLDDLARSVEARRRSRRGS